MPDNIAIKPEHEEAYKLWGRYPFGIPAKQKLRIERICKRYSPLDPLRLGIIGMESTNVPMGNKDSPTVD